jgi:hypothetical protein
MHDLKSRMLLFPPSRSRKPDLESLKGWRCYFWLALLLCCSVAFSLSFACATPFAAFSAIAALTLNRRDSAVVTAGVWFTNQVVGFTLLKYPGTVSCVAWGIALGLAAIIATFAARWVTGVLVGRAWIARYAAAFLAAFAVFEGILFLVGLLILGVMEGFSLAIVSWIFAINGGAFLGLSILNRCARGLGLAPARVSHLLTT